MNAPPPTPASRDQDAAIRKVEARARPMIEAARIINAVARIVLRPSRSDAVPANSETMPHDTDVIDIRFATAVRSVSRSRAMSSRNGARETALLLARKAARESAPSMSQ